MVHTVLYGTIDHQVYRRHAAWRRTISFAALWMVLCFEVSMQCTQPTPCTGVSVEETDGAGTPVYSLNSDFHWEYQVVRPETSPFLDSFFELRSLNNLSQLVLTKELDLEAIYESTKMDLSSTNVTIVLKCLEKINKRPLHINYKCQLHVIAVDEYPLELRSACFNVREDIQVGSVLFNQNDLVRDRDVGENVTGQLCLSTYPFIMDKVLCGTNLACRNASFAFNLLDNGDVKLARRLDYEGGDTVMCMVARVEKAYDRMFVVAVVVENLNDSPPVFSSQSYHVPSLSNFKSDWILATDPDGDEVTKKVILTSSDQYLGFVYRWYLQERDPKSEEKPPPVDHTVIVIEARDKSKLNPSRVLVCPWFTSYAILEVSADSLSNRCQFLMDIRKEVHMSPSHAYRGWLPWATLSALLCLVLLIAIFITVVFRRVSRTVRHDAKNNNVHTTTAPEASSDCDVTPLVSQN